jgi:hypothetical protein
MYLQAVLDFVGNFDEVLHVLFRTEHLTNTAASGRQEFFFQSADGQHLAAQRDLAGHRDVGANRDVGEDRHDRGCDRSAGARAILGRRAFRQVDVQVHLLIEIRSEAELLRTVPHHRERRRDRFVHYVAELAGGGGLALAR